ncbi:GyrI-like domain-containing protein [Kitasatospora sp. NBC_00085]|uniref:GyrI-like domain-containing protein n=1 Tax=unclassified Kitasatospora TaxID=2633591 RepID=UPI00324C8F4C
MTKTDHRRTDAALYSAKAAPRPVDVPWLDFLAVDGVGDPAGDPAFAAATAALYAASYTLKFAVRAETGVDYAVLPLEGLWRSDDPEFDPADPDAYRPEARTHWAWTLLIRQPVPYGDAQLATALAKAKAKAGAEAAAGLRRVSFAEGRCIQVLHRGPYAEEPRTVKLLHEHLAAEGLAPADRHHEIYLTDPTRTAPERQRTILRQPVA